MKGKRILITGGAGLIGSHIAELAVPEQPAEILVLDNFVRGRRDNLAVAMAGFPVRVVEGDIRDTALLKRLMDGIDIVFHQVLCEGSGNEFLSAAIGNCDALVRNVYVQNLRSVERLALTCHEHEAIIEAVRREDANLLAHLCAEHIAMAFEFYRESVLGLEPKAALRPH